MMFEYALAILLLLSAGLVTSTIWSRTSNWMRAAAMAAFLLMLPVAVGTSWLSLGHAMPYQMLNLFPSGKHKIIAARFFQDEAIYVWLDIRGGTPVAVKFPWDNRTADKLYGMLKAAKDGVREAPKLGLPEEFSWDENDFQFHPAPQYLQPPPKEPVIAPAPYDRSAYEGGGEIIIIDDDPGWEDDE